MDHVAEFEKNVKNRIRDFKSLQSRIKKDQPLHDHKASCLFLGVAFGVIASQVACLCKNN